MTLPVRMLLTPPRLRFLLPALLATAVIAPYGRVTGYDFISIDDFQYVSENPQVAGGLSWAGVAWAFKTPVAGNWHPLTMLSHMLDCQLYGLSAGGQHLTNVLFHLANTLLLFWLLLRITDLNPRPSSSTLWPCALVAALFALHPLHVESVAWVSERKDVLSAFFFLLSLLAYSTYVTVATARTSGATPHAPRSTLHPPLPASVWYVLSLLFFILGLLSKPMVVTLPFVLLLLDYWPLNRFGPGTAGYSSRGAPAKQPSTTAPPVRGSKFRVQGSRFLPLVLEKLPFLALSLFFSSLTYVLQKQSGAVVDFAASPLKARLANAMISYARYLGKALWPDALALPYPWLDWPADAVAGATFLFVALSLVALAAARRRKYLLVGWFWFAGMLVPTIGLVQVGMQGMADRYTYLPLIGVFIALAWGLASLPKTPARAWLAAVGAMLLLASLAATTSAQVSHWKNSETLFEHAVRVVPHNSAARYLLGALYESHGQADQALPQFTEAIRDNPENVRARCGLGYLLGQQGKLEEAAREYEAALQSQPDLAKAQFGLAEVLRRQGRADPAIAHYLCALQSRPDLPEAHYQLAGLFSRRHEPSTALAHLQQAARLAPDWPLPLNDLAWALATQPQADLRNGTEALRLASRAVSLTRRENPATLDTLAAAYAEAGRFPEAVSTAQLAIQLANAAGQTNLALDIAPRLKLYASQKPYRE